MVTGWGKYEGESASLNIFLSQYLINFERQTNQPTNQSFIFQRQNTSVKIYYDSYLNLYCVIKKSKAYHKASFPLRYWSTHLSAASSEVTSFHRWQYYNIMLGCETCPLHIILKNKPLYHQPHLSFPTARAREKLLAYLF